MILIATPTRGQIEASTASDIVQLVKRFPDADWALGFGTILSNNRTLLIHAAVKAKASHILFIDSDMRFPPDALERLLSHKKDIVGVNYRQRTNDQYTARKDGNFISSRERTGTEEVDTIGFGMVLIDICIFTSSLRPMPSDCFAMNFDPSLGLFAGEDVNFCNEARKLGYKIFVDHDLSKEIKHIGSVDLAI